MADLFFPRALVADGWAASVRVGIGTDGTILHVDADAPREGAERVDGAAVPGVPNLHSHAFQRALAGLTERGRPDGDSFWGWRERMYAFLERIGPDDVEAVAGQLFVELLRHGYTSVVEFHYLRNAPDGTPYDDPLEMARRLGAAADTAGVGLTILPTLYAAADFGGAPLAGAQRRFRTSVENVLSDVATLAAATEGKDIGHGAGLALHSLRAVPADALAEAVDSFERILPGAPIHVHVAEQRREVEACLARSGARPVEWLLDHAPVGPAWCLVHATHLTRTEVGSLAASGAVVGLCPTTEANLGDGLFPLPEYAAAGGAWGVGTDSHVSVSPVADLRLLEYGQRLVHEERNVAAGGRAASTARALLDRAWVGGARASGRTVGRLAPGARADVVVLDLEHPALVAREGDDLLDAWIFSGEDTPVRHVMVGGRWVVSDGRHVHQTDVAERYRRALRGLLAGG